MADGHEGNSAGEHHTNMATPSNTRSAGRSLGAVACAVMAQCWIAVYGVALQRVVSAPQAQALL